MIKLYITAIESNEDGTAVTLFEDYQVLYSSNEDIAMDDDLGDRLAQKIEEVEAVNNQTSSPL